MALGVELLTAAKAYKKGQDLPEPITKSMARLAERQNQLTNALAEEFRVQADALDLREYDRIEDAAFSATFTWLSGWAKNPKEGSKKGPIAEKLLATLFPDGLKFTLLPYKQEWAQAEARLIRLREEGLEKDFARLGGEEFVEALFAAHVAYGRVLGLTRVADAPELPASKREALDAFMEALRNYVLKVAGSAEPNDELSTVRRDKLLAPLAGWQTSANSAKPTRASGGVGDSSSAGLDDVGEDGTSDAGEGGASDVE